MTNLERQIDDAKRSGKPELIGLAVVCECLLREVRELRTLVTPLDRGSLPPQQPAETGGRP